MWASVSSSLVKMPSKKDLSPPSLSLSGAHAASKHQFVLSDGVFLSPSSQKNTFHVSHDRFPLQGKRVILESKSVFF